MFDIFAESHKIIASKVHENVFDIYGLKLNKDKLLWGSICPDLLPQFRFIRHYKEESLNYITNEIVKIIFFSRFIDINKGLDPLTMKILSKKIGIISHYLTDYVCLPHANRWTFFGSMKKHIKYESKLNELASNFDFNNNIIDLEDLDIDYLNPRELKIKVKNYIENIVEEYSLKEGYDQDLNFALGINLKVSYFVLDTIEAYSKEMQRNLVFEF